MDNDRIQEIFLMLGDKLALVNKVWWYTLAGVLVFLIPLHYLVKLSLVQTYTSTYAAPKLIYSAAAQEPLQVLDKQILSLGDNAYSGFVKVKNTNLEWGVADQQYTVQFKTYGGTILNTISGQTFILPASEKLIVFSRFTSQTHPDAVDVTLAQTHFILKPDVPDSLELERISLQNNPSGLVISAGVKNLTAFTIKQINLPIAVYNNKNEIVGVNFTYISDVLSGETRTFQYAWPITIPGAVRAEITPEINIFDRGVLTNLQPVLPIIDQGGP